MSTDFEQIKSGNDELDKKIEQWLNWDKVSKKKFGFRSPPMIKFANNC
jgi:hypothetical protein